jgi:dihydrofolate synthase/folylpolyglutamate synthase
MLKDYQKTLNFLYANLPMFQRIGPAALKPDLSNTIALCQSLGNPQTKFKSIHVAGTNGKGSTSHMLASILQSSGYKTGLYTSPHLKSFTERIKINGREIHEEFIIRFVNIIRPQIELLKPSFFEITVALAFDYFAQEKIDVAVIEVGLGGRLDSTNVITPELSVITNIGWDHTDILGDTLAKIATEKAGIIKHKVPVVISERQHEVEHIFKEKSIEANSPISFATDRFNAVTSDNAGTLDVFENREKFLKNLTLPLQGSYQHKNVLGVLAAVKVLNESGWKIPHQAIRKGLESVVEQTGLKGRWQILGRRPLIVCDTGHNLDGIKEVVRQIQRYAYTRLYVVLGMVKGKDVSSILKLLPKKAYYFFCQPDIPRALDAAMLFEHARALDLKGEIILNVNKAISQAKGQAAEGDMIFIGGSTFVVAEIDNL